jgi:hypothetical protein
MNNSLENILLESVTEVVEPVPEVIEPVPEVIEPVIEVLETVIEVVEPVPKVIEPVIEVVETVIEVVETVIEVVEPVIEVVEPVPEVEAIINKSLKMNEEYETFSSEEVIDSDEEYTMKKNMLINGPPRIIVKEPEPVHEPAKKPISRSVLLRKFR